MKINLIGEPKIIMSNPDSKHNYFGWPTVAKLQDGTIVVGASGFRLDHICPFGKAVVAYSHDNGESYTPPGPIIDTPLDDRDVGLCVFGESGLIVTTFNETSEIIRPYIDFNNRSEADQKYVSAYLDSISKEDEEKYYGSLFRISNDCGKTFGEIHKCPVSSPHGPIELKDGSILWVGCLFEGMYDGVEKVQAYKINLDGTSEYLGKIENVTRNGEIVHYAEPYAFQADDGRIIAHIRSKQEDLFSIYQSVSNDGGKTWSTPECIMPEDGGAPAHIMRHSSGLLVCTYSFRGAPPDWTLPFGIRMAFSKDNGQTWDYPYEIYSTSVYWDMGYPSTIELDDGTMLTVFYAHQENGGRAVIWQQKWSFEE